MKIFFSYGNVSCGVILVGIRLAKRQVILADKLIEAIASIPANDRNRLGIGLAGDIAVAVVAVVEQSNYSRMGSSSHTACCGNIFNIPFAW